MNAGGAGVARVGSQGKRPKRRELPQNRSQHATIEDGKEEEVSEQQISSLSEINVTGNGEYREKDHALFYVVRALLERKMETFPRLNFLDHDIRPYRMVPAKQIISYRIRRVVSPLEFYLEYVLDRNCYTYRDFFPEMQQFYNNEENQKKNALMYGKVLKGRCYVCKDFEDAKWHRVRVHLVYQVTAFAKVFYCDLGKMQIVPFTRLLELDPRFALCSAQVFRAYLYDVFHLPAAGEKNQSGLLTPAACTYFKKLVEGKEFDGIVMARSDKIVTDCLPDVVTHIGVVLFEKSPNLAPDATGTVHNCTVNAKMVDAGYAQAIGIFAGCKSTLHSHANPEVRESRIDQSRLEAAFPLQPSQPSNHPAKVIPNVLGKKELALLYMEPLINFPPPEKSWLPEHLERINHTQKTLDEFTMGLLPATLGKQLVRINLSFASGPDNIILHLASQLDDLNIMQQFLTRAVSSTPETDEKNLVPGSFVACVMIELSKSIWCRALLKKYEKATKKCQLLLVDYGNDITVLSKHVRPLPKDFEEIPSFCHRIHLDPIGMRPNGLSCWTTDACSGFRKHLYSWQKKVPVYYLFKPHHSEWIELQDFNQSVEYRSEEGRWVAGPRKRIARHFPADALRDHPMLRSLYCSLGVEIHYEVVHPDSSYWHYETVCNNMLVTGFATQDSRLVERRRIHLNIVDSPILVERAPELGSSSKPMYHINSQPNKKLRAHQKSVSMATPMLRLLPTTNASRESTRKATNDFTTSTDEEETYYSAEEGSVSMMIADRSTLSTTSVTIDEDFKNLTTAGSTSTSSTINMDYSNIATVGSMSTASTINEDLSNIATVGSTSSCGTEPSENNVSY